MKERRIPCALLSGAVIFSICASAGCSSKSRTNTLSEEEIVAQASSKAEQLGIPKDSLHGQYSFFLDYVDRVEKNKTFDDSRELFFRIFPEVAGHIKDENKNLFLDKLSQLKFEIGECEFGGVYSPTEDKLLLSDQYYQWQETDGCFIIYHEMTHFVDRYIDGLEQYVIYDGKDFSAIDLDYKYEGAYETVYCDFLSEGLADLSVAKTLSKSFDSYHGVCNFLTTMEYIYGSDVVEDMLFDRNTTLKFISILQDLGYSNGQIIKIIQNFNEYTFIGNADIEEALYSFEDVLVDMYQKKIGPDWQKDPQFCFLIYNQTCAYDQERQFCGYYRHREIADVVENEREKMHTRCAKINQTAAIFEEEEDPENWHATFFLDGNLYLSECTWIWNDDECEKEIHLIRYDFEKETLLEHKMVDKLEFPDKLHKDYLEKQEEN